MRHFDLTPLYRSTIGFDRLAGLLDAAGLDAEGNGYPPYNIERLADNKYRITMAVAGFTDVDIKIEVKESSLTVKGEKAVDAAKNTEFLHRGIAQRAFERRFQLADYVEVDGAEMKDGLLHIDLVRNLPERMKPRTVSIRSNADAAKQIEAVA